MADLNVIYKIAADISGLQSGVDRAAKATEGLNSTAARVGSALTKAFTVTAVVSFGKTLLDTADALTKLSAKTGISIVALQQLEIAGDDAGNTIDEMAAAITAAQNKLASSDKAFVAAAESLGLSVAELRQLNPEDLFATMANAIRGVEDPAEQVRLAMDLMGKTGVAVLPTMKRGVEELYAAASGPASKEAVEAIDSLGDAMLAAWRRVKSTAIEASGQAIIHARENPTGFLTQYLFGVKDPRDVIREAEQAAKALDPFIQKTLELNRAKTGGILPQALPKKDAIDAEQAARDLDRLEAADRKRAGELKKATDEQIRHNQSLREYHNWLVMREFEEAAEQMKRTAAATATAAEELDQFNRMLFFGGSQLETSTQLMQALERSITQVGGAVEGLAATPLEPFTESFGKKLFAGFGDFLKTNLADSIIKAFQGGGDVIKSLGSTVGAWFTQKGGAIEQAATKGLTSILGKGLGGALAALVPGLGTLLGPLLEKVTGWFKNLFGGKEKETNKTREQFVQLAGGLDALNQKAAAAGVTLTAMLNAKTPEAYKKAIDELTAAFEFQDSAMATLDETVQRYGFTIQELGPAFARQELDKRAQRLYQDFKVLAAAGIPVNTIIQKMGKSINEFTQDAIKTGTEVPAAMKPMLEQMIAHGELLDENGVAYESLEETGLTFSETMTQGFAKLIKTVDRLTEAIARGLGIALDNLPDEKNIDVNVNINRSETTPATPGETGAPRVGIPGGPVGPEIPSGMLTPGELMPTSMATGQMAAGATLQPSAAGVAPVIDTGNRVNVDLTMNIDGVFSEGDLVSTVQRRVVPIIHETWNANVAGTRTQARDVLGVA